MRRTPRSQFDFAELSDGSVPIDRNALMIRQWYGSLLLMRAQMLGELGCETEAGRLQELGTAFAQP